MIAVGTDGVGDSNGTRAGFEVCGAKSGRVYVGYKHF